MLEKVEDFSLRSRNIHFVSIDQSKAAHQVNHVETTIKGVEDSSVNIFVIAPVSSKVVVGIGQGVHYQLD